MSPLVISASVPSKLQRVRRAWLQIQNVADTSAVDTRAVVDCASWASADRRMRRQLDARFFGNGDNLIKETGQPLP